MGLSSVHRPYAGMAIMAVAVGVFPIVASYNPYYLNVANIMALNAIIVVGLNLLIGYAGQISLGHAAFYGLGAYSSAILTATYGMSPWLAMPVAAFVTALCALGIAVPSLKLHGHYLVMATLGFNVIVNVVMLQWDKVTGGPSGLPGIPYLKVGNWAFDTDLKVYYLVWSVAWIAVLLSLNLVNSRAGRGLRALQGSEIAASSLGVRTKQYKVKVFVLSAVFGSVAGSLYAHYLSFVSPKTFDIFASVELVTMVVVGGMGSIWGGLSGTALMTSLPTILHVFDEFKDICYGLILVLILLFVPEGPVVALRNRWMARNASLEEAKTGGTSELTDPVLAASVRTETRDRFRPIPGEAGAILAVRNVSMHFGGLMALNGVSFEIDTGSITALIGPNGAGKTTMINVISGIYRPPNGAVMLAGEDVTGRPSYRMAERGLTRTFQNIQIFQQMTVLENVMVGMHAKTGNEFLWSMFHLPGFAQEEKEIEARAREVIGLVGLEGKESWPAGALAYGLQKRLEMARSLAMNPKLILLDEPVAGLNMTESRAAAELILRIRSQGISILLVEHDMNLVMGISDKVVVLNYGRKISEGPPKEIQSDAEVLSAYLGGVA